MRSAGRDKLRRNSTRGQLQMSTKKKELSVGGVHKEERTFRWRRFFGDSRVGSLEVGRFGNASNLPICACLLLCCRGVQTLRTTHIGHSSAAASLRQRTDSAIQRPAAAVANAAAELEGRTGARDGLAARVAAAHVRDSATSAGLIGGAVAALGDAPATVGKTPAVLPAGLKALRGLTGGLPVRRVGDGVGRRRVLVCRPRVAARLGGRERIADFHGRGSFRRVVCARFTLRRIVGHRWRLRAARDEPDDERHNPEPRRGDGISPQGITGR